MSQNELKEASRYELKVKVSKRLSYHEGNMWGIFSLTPIKIKTEGFYPEVSSWGNFVIKGNMIELQEGKEYDIVISDKIVDKQWGDYYPIVEVKVEKLDTAESQYKFLESIVTEYQYKAIVETYPDCMIIDMIIENQVDLTKARGIGEYTASKIQEKIEKNKDIGVLINELSELNVTGKAITKIVKHYGSATTALYKVRQSIYNLCEVSGFGFKKVDEYALRQGEKMDSPNRIRAYCFYYFDKISNQGHSWVNEKLFLKEAIDDLNINGTHIRNFLNSETGSNEFYWDKQQYKISTKKMYNNEKKVLSHLLRIESKYEPVEIDDIDDAIKSAEDSLGIIYTDEQRNAIKTSLKNGVIILNGKGGTGKTTIVKGIVEVLESQGLVCHSCALSGKASQVLQSKGISSATIHRTLSLGMGEKENVEEIGADVLIVDESSMINAGLFALVVRAIKDGAKIIIVGDSGQLSGIGHGDVLRDLLATKLFTTIELKQIHRQAQDSGIIEIASKIREGKQITSNNLVGQEVFGVNKDMIVRGYADRDDISKDLVKILQIEAKKVKKPEDLLELQIITANKDRGNSSARTINIIAQEIFNDLDKPHISRNGYDFREGDKVIVQGNSYGIEYYDDHEHYLEVLENQEKLELGLLIEYEVIQEEIKQLQLEISSAEMDIMMQFEDPDDAKIEIINNDYINNLQTKIRELRFQTDSIILNARIGDLFNGTMGIVKKVDIKNKQVHIQYDNLGYVVVNQDEMDNVELAYACTCHRLQGSTIKNVIVILDFTSYGLLSRQWVYTAITRASNKCVMLVETRALSTAISTDASGNRQTFLGDFINSLKSVASNLDEAVEIFEKQAVYS